ncbi:usg protein [Hyphococcus lacteus]|uniref:Usg protein n=1 Tax=Hyphococcus lacteus TaxID=3143536 RepID=A0ABV3Z4C7_9PROT
MSTDSAFEKQLAGYRLATAEIFYHLPDHPDLLQTYIWQDYDIAPQYPVLKKFLDFWSHELEGPLHSVRLASQKLITASELRSVGAFALN